MIALRGKALYRVMRFCSCLVGQTLHTSQNILAHYLIGFWVIRVGSRAKGLVGCGDKLKETGTMPAFSVEFRKHGHFLRHLGYVVKCLGCRRFADSVRTQLGPISFRWWHLAIPLLPQYARLQCRGLACLWADEGV